MFLVSLIKNQINVEFFVVLRKLRHVLFDQVEEIFIKMIFVWISLLGNMPLLF